MSKDVIFYVNGIARLLMSCAIGDEFYPNHRKHLILLHQRPHTSYEALLPHVRQNFTQVHTLRLASRNYANSSQFLDTYFNRYTAIRSLFSPGAEVVLFGLRTPVQKFIIRHNKAMGNTVRVFAGSLTSDRYFAPRNDEWWRRLGRRVFARAFEYQHDYDVFYVFNKETHRESPWHFKLEQMFNLYDSVSFKKYAGMLTSGSDLRECAEYDEVFFGQPLSNSAGVLTRDAEESMLRAIIGERRVLILPHPNEVLAGDNKYRVVPNGRILHTKLPNDLLLPVLRPKTTMTYASTIGIAYATMNPASTNYFYPIRQTAYETLSRYERTLRNIVVSHEFVGADGTKTR